MPKKVDLKLKCVERKKRDVRKKLPKNPEFCMDCSLHFNSKVYNFRHWKAELKTFSAFPIKIGRRKR